VADGSETTIFVVEDDAAVRDSLQLLLRLRGFAARGFASADEFLAEVGPNQGGCLLLDLRMPGKGGLELQAELLDRGLRLPVVVITAHGDVAAARAAFRAGAIDFLEKPLDEDALLSAIRAALDRDRQRRRSERMHADVEERIARLTARERDVLWLAADGRKNREIAAALGLSPRTVEIYKAHMMEKLQVNGLPELLALLRDAKPGPGGAP
jgi:FixJ family two-component response regulator